MKRLSLLLASTTVLALTPAFAQLQKNTWTLGGSLGSAGLAGGNGFFYLSGSITPRAGYFLTDRFMVGAGLGLGLSMLRTPQFTGASNDYTLSSLSLSPFGRYYFAKPQVAGVIPRGIIPFAEAGLGLSGYTYSARTPAEYGHSGTGLSAHAGIGASSFLTRNVALETMVLYQYTFAGGVPVVSAPVQNFNRGLGFSVGLQFYLNRGDRSGASSAASPARD